jgi:hypothetical protein
MDRKTVNYETTSKGGGGEVARKRGGRLARNNMRIWILRQGVGENWASKGVRL